MPWCPNCKEEFVRGVANCSDCGAPLVDALPGEDASGRPIPGSDEPSLLTTVSGEAQAEMLRARLEGAGIPTMLIDKGAGGYLKAYMGYSNAPVDIYVQKSSLGDARALLDAPPEPIGDGPEEERAADEEEATDSFMERRRFVSRFVTAVFIVNIALAAFFLIGMLIRALMGL